MKDVMKNNSVTKVEIVEESTKEITNIITNHIIPYSSINIFEEDDDKFIAVDVIDNRDVLFFFIEQSKVDSFVNLLRESNLLYSSDNVTEKILLGDFVGTKYENVMKRDEFKPMFDKFLLKNLDYDKVLDKINIKGINKLTDIDKVILEKEY